MQMMELQVGSVLSLEEKLSNYYPGLQYATVSALWYDLLFKSSK